jgi:hypothetical protein
MKRMMWDFGWQEIQFVELGIKLIFFRRASSDFYSKFYGELFRRYENYDSLPSVWRQKKSNTAYEISKLVENETLVLSVGCGLGYVEKEIVGKVPKLKIDAYDFAETANKWLREVKRVNSIQSLEGSKKYNFIYCTQLLYALSDKEIFEFSSMVKERLSKDGVFLTVDYSLNSKENGIEDNSIKSKVKKMMGPLYLFLYPLYLFLLRGKSAQFWGWQRDNEELVKIFRMNGFDMIKVFSSVGQSFIIFKLGAN